MEDLINLQTSYKLNECHHKFHTLCLQKYWYMERLPTVDEYGVVFLEKAPESKICPICRKEADDFQATEVKEYKQNIEKG